MNQYTTYGQFLNQSYRKILEACLADEAIDTLKILENKDYLLLRINQLFSEIYVAEREKVIQDQAAIISSLQQVQRGGKAVDKPEKCFNCQLMKDHISEMEHQITQFEKKVNQNQSTQEKSVKKIESMLLKEIQQLKKDLKGLQEQNIYKKIEFEEQTSKLNQQNSRLKALIKQQSEKNEKNAEKQKSKVKNIEQQKQMLQNQVFNYLESKGKEEKEMRELTAKYTNLNIARQRQQNELNLIRNENSILEQKLKHLDEENLYLKQKNSLTEREIKNLKKQLQQALFDKESQKYNKLQQPCHNEMDQELIENEKINKKSEIMRKSLQYQKNIQALKQELAQKQSQFSEISVENEKTILKLTDELRKAQIKMEKELRNSKEEAKKLIQKNSQQLQGEYKQEKQEIIKKFERTIAQKDLLCEKLQQKIIVLNRNLNENQHFSRESLKQFESEKNRLLKQIEQQRHNSSQLRKYYNKEKLSEQKLEKQNFDKYQEILVQKNELEKLLGIKQKQIREYKKDILKNNEQVTSLQIKIDDLKNKLSLVNQSIDEQKTKCKSITEKLKEKVRQCHQVQQRYSQLAEEKQQLEKKIAVYIINEKRLQQKIRRFESQIAHKRQLLLSMHEANQQQVIDVFAKAQQTTVQARKQLQNYYLNLLKANEEKTTNATIYQLEKVQQEQLEKMRLKNADCEEKIKKIKAKYSEQEKQRISNESKIYSLIQQNEQLKNENSKVLDMVHEQKKKNLSIIKAYQDKMLEYYNNFSEFKRQFYLSLKQELTSIKMEMYNIVEAAKQQKIVFQQFLYEYGEKIARQIEIITHKHQLQLDKVRNEYEYQKILKLEEQKREIRMQCDMKLKEQSIEFYTIMAQKQHQINTLSEKQAKLQKKMSDLDQKNDQIEKMAKETYKKNQQLKQIIAKMNSKVTESERSCFSAQNELEFYKKSNMELKKQINQLETNFKEKIQQCRQKYSTENQRLFAKYEKQFSKFIVSNKKSLEFSMLSNSCSNIHVPTKGIPTQGKLDKIQRQIEEQKRKLNILEKGMQSKTKFEKTSKLTVQRDNPRPYKKF